MSNSHAEDNVHSGPVKNPKQLLWTVAAAFIIPIFIIIGLVLFVTNAFKPAGTNEVATMGLGGITEVARDRAQALRLQKVGSVEIRDANRPLATGEAVYKAQCSACHAAGVAGAPKFGDKGAWEPRLAQGYDKLLHSVLAGKGAMAPQGGGDFSDLEIGRAVVYMANEGGGKLPEPKAAASATEANAASTEPPATAAAAPAAPPPAAPVATPVAASAPAAENKLAAPTDAVAAPAATAAAAVAVAASTPAANAAAGEALYKSTCFVCHAAGVAGAPKLGDKEAWAPRIAAGMDEIMKIVQNGKGAMPPRGGSAASDADLHAAVEYMVNSAK